MKHQAIAAALAAAFIAGALASGSAYNRPATLGAGIASLSAIASLFAMGRSARRAEKQMKGALVVMVVFFLLRLLLVVVGAAVVVRGGDSIVPFIVAFFVPYFVFVAVEASFLHSLRRTPGSNA